MTKDCYLCGGKTTREDSKTNVNDTDWWHITCEEEWNRRLAEKLCVACGDPLAENDVSMHKGCTDLNASGYASP